MSLDTVAALPNPGDPSASYLNSSCLDLLLIELVPTVHQLAGREMGRAGAVTSHSGAADASSSVAGSNTSIAAVRAPTTLQSQQQQKHNPADDAANPVDEDEQRETAARRLEAVGYRVGQGLAERFSRDRPRFLDTLDVIKFLCKDVWTLVFRKQVDNLKTNHRGVYVLTDSAFRPFARMSMQSSAEATAHAAPFLSFPCGVIRGALASMGIAAVVQAETPELPTAIFQVKTMPAKA